MMRDWNLLDIMARENADALLTRMEVARLFRAHPLTVVKMIPEMPPAVRGKRGRLEWRAGDLAKFVVEKGAVRLAA